MPKPWSPAVAPFEIFKPLLPPMERLASVSSVRQLVQPFTKPHQIESVASRHDCKLLGIDYCIDHTLSLVSRVSLLPNTLNRLTGQNTGSAILAHVIHNPKCFRIPAIRNWATA